MNMEDGGHVEVLNLAIFIAKLAYLAAVAILDV